ncbi:MAG: hypothetical protein ABSF03_17880 [Streptosporangiaceae bacterium]
MSIRGDRAATAPAGPPAEAAGSPGQGRRPWWSRRPWWIWAAPFAIVLTVLFVRNRFLFTTKWIEQGDAAANSIRIQQAMHFTLLVGNYSREGFSHPGPAYMYVQAFGQWLFESGLHVVPTAWNAHLLAVFVLNGALLALAVGIVYGWARSLRAAAACFAVVLVFGAVHPTAINSDWMPYMYVVMYCVFLIAAASVAAGHVRDLWIFALTGWFLIHGHACFLFIVPVITAGVLAVLLAEHRRAPVAALRRFVRDGRRAWIPAVAISALFALPIVVNLALHWPGDFGKYFAYSKSSAAGGHSVLQIVRYALWFWWPDRHGWLAPVLLFAGAIAVAAGLARGGLRRFLLMLLGINVVSSLAVGLYAAAGIDDLNQYYIAYFYWSAPLLALLVIAVGLSQALGARTGTALAAAGAVAALAVFALVPGMRTSTEDTDSALPHAVAVLAAHAPGREIVLSIQHDAWIDTTGFLVQAERVHIRACVDDPYWTFMMTAQFICTPQQAAGGVRFTFDSPHAPSSAPILLRFGHTDVVAGPVTRP